MWAYLFSVPRTKGATDEVERTGANAAYMLPGTNAQPSGVPPLFIHLGKKRVWVLVKADLLTNEQARILSDNDCLLTGTTKLVWWEPIMLDDFRRTLDENDSDPEFKVCKIDLGKVGGKEAELLAMMTQSMPDGEDKDRLLEILRGRKETKH